MPIPTPFHPRTSALCTSMFWKEWAGYHAVNSYDTCHEREYHAIRHAAGLIDVTPLYKYVVSGPDAQRLLSRVMTRDIRKLKKGRVTYCCWCDDAGKVMDDGTVWHVGKNQYRVTAAEPSYAWLCENARGLKVAIEDTTEQIGALALQGPTSRAILADVIESETPIEKLRFFRLTRGLVAGKHPVIVTRTGYTGDLGYEIWVENKHAVGVYDALMEAGKPHGIWPAGIAALDVSRVEAGFIMNGVDYFSAHHCLIERRKSTPFELGLGWTVNLGERPKFNGQRALEAEKVRGSAWATVGLIYDWDAYEEVYARYGLPPGVPSGADRGGVPIYASRGAKGRGERNPRGLSPKQVGYCTTTSWSPVLKQYLALATVDAAYREHGTRLFVEITVEYTRYKIPAIVSETPFFNPKRKRSTP